MAMPWTSANDGCEIYYEAEGSGPTVVFASGFMGITDIWRAQFEALSDSYRCIAFDNRGAGRSGKQLPSIAYGVDRHARDLDAVLAAAGVADNVVIVGHSMGGNTASTFYFNHPGRVAGLVYVGSYVSGHQIRDAGNTLDNIKSAVRTAAGRLAFFEAVGLPAHLAVESTKWPLYAVLGNAESFMAFDMTDRIGDIAVPCLIIHGDRDIVSPLDPCGYSLESGLKDARLVVFEGVNHCPAVEAPDRASALIREFLDATFHTSC
jgi:pimeloyl-ACP methyl ester carboxylesterase